MSRLPSDSRSPTPTPTNPSPTSRRNAKEEISPQDTQSLSSQRDDPSDLNTIPPKAESPNVSIPHTRPIHPIDSSIADQRMAKRIRTSDVTSKSDGDSRSPQRLQGNVASTSTNNAAMMMQSVQTIAAGEVVQPKKKRTRTLTTPYQAAVLHSLLAQSRFPTTAKREEVGRLIGLSARKVQIWFQNQRQKARRPRSQSDANIKHPHYGAFSSVTPSGPEYGVQPSFSTHSGADSQSLIQLASSSSQSLHSASTPASTPDSYSSLSDAPQLLGPGVPGLDMHPRGAPLGGRNSSSISLPQIGQLDVRYSSAGPSRLMHQNPPSTSPTPGHLLPRPLSVPSHLQDPYRTLPPIMLGPGLQTRASISPPEAPQPLAASRPYADTISPPAAMATDRPFIIYRPSSPLAAGTSTTTSIPPPYTLQPRPQWDRTFAPPPTRITNWSPPGSSRDPPVQPILAPPANLPLLPIVSAPNSGQNDGIGPVTQEIHMDAPPQLPPLHQSRVGRYDPVRETVFPFATPSPPVPSPPLPPPDTEYMGERAEPSG